MSSPTVCAERRPARNRAEGATGPEPSPTTVTFFISKLLSVLVFASLVVDSANERPERTASAKKLTVLTIFRIGPFVRDS